MTKRRNLLDRLQQLGEIDEIINSMKNLAFMETHRLSNFIDKQQQVVSGIEAMASDFLGYHPQPLTSLESAQPIYLLFGSERGFCGDFNDQIAKDFERLSERTPGVVPQAIAIGNKLGQRLQDNPYLVAFIDGANVAEEVSKTLMQVLVRIHQLQDRSKDITLNAIYYHETLRQKTLLPPFQESIASTPATGYAPLLNVDAPEFFIELVDQYLFAVLHQIAYTSLMKENQRRVQHMQGASQHLEKRIHQLTLRSNRLRQEEITEEIESILLTAESLLPTDVSFSH